MKTASARFFFWSASFHEDGGLTKLGTDGTFPIFQSLGIGTWGQSRLSPVYFPGLFSPGLFHQLAFFRSKLQAHILLPLQAYRCLYPLEL